MKNILKKLAYTLLSIVILLFLLIGSLWLIDIIQTKFIYSIPMPNIIGKFDISDEDVSVWGLENIANDEIANLRYTVLECYKNECIEESVSLANINGVFIFPYYKEYNINYRNKNKILFSNDINTISGEIDLINKTVTYSTLGGLENNEPRNIEIVTDNDKILKLEKRIIKKYLRK